MNLLVAAFAWLFNPAHYGGPNGLDTRAIQHIGISLFILVIAAVIAIPVGFAIGHTGRGRAVISLAGGLRALPTLGLMIIIALSIGIGFEAPVIALVVLSFPSILAGAYAGIDAVDRQTIDAARAIGMTEWQVLWKVEVPLGLPLLIGGLRAASLQIVATATLADYIGVGGLGHFLFVGLNTQDYPQMLAGALAVVILALLSELIFGILTRIAVPVGVRIGNRNAALQEDVSVRSRRPRVTTG
jgi:osmoprotectant transport system permease protein